MYFFPLDTYFFLLIEESRSLSEYDWKKESKAESDTFRLDQRDVQLLHRFVFG